MNWISVKDKLPDTTENVLCCNVRNETIMTGLYIKFKEGGGRWGSTVDGLTHWMPLPKPPTI